MHAKNLVKVTRIREFMGRKRPSTLSFKGPFLSLPPLT